MSLLSPEEAVRIVLADAVGKPPEAVPLAAAHGRIGAEPLESAATVPPFDSSAMDGYAVGRVSSGVWLEVVAESRAGHPAERGPGDGEVVRISTGAMIPAGTYSVVPVEQVAEEGERVRLETDPAADANVRRAGEDVKPGDRLLAAGTRIGPAELGVLASVGVTELQCAPRPRLAVLTTGDELVPVGQELGPGQIHDTSSYSLAAMASEAGAAVEHVGRLPDEQAATREGLAAVLGCDVVVVCGGLSVGPHDHVKPALAELGVEERFWRVALRPGKPTWFGVREGEGGRCLVFGLPGNPVSAMVTFHVFVAPALRKMQGLEPRAPRAHAVLDEAIGSASGRVEYVRCVVESRADRLHARPSRSAQGSHVLTSMLGADALAVVPAEREGLEAGEEVLIESMLSVPPGWVPLGTGYGVQ